MNLPVTLTGKVISGNRIGRRFDSPTANIIPKEDLTLTHGVYYSTVDVDGKKLYGITNLGVRPTVSDDGRVCAETYIYDFNGDLYDKTISVTLLHFSRSERRFDSLDELFATVENDLAEGRKYHSLG